MNYKTLPILLVSDNEQIYEYYGMYDEQKRKNFLERLPLEYNGTQEKLLISWILDSYMYNRKSYNGEQAHFSDLRIKHMLYWLTNDKIEANTLKEEFNLNYFPGDPYHRYDRFLSFDDKKKLLNDYFNLFEFDLYNNYSKQVLVDSYNGITGSKFAGMIQTAKSIKRIIDISNNTKKVLDIIGFDVIKKTKDEGVCKKINGK